MPEKPKPAGVRASLKKRGWSVYAQGLGGTEYRHPGHPARVVQVLEGKPLQWAILEAAGLGDLAVGNTVAGFETAMARYCAPRVLHGNHRPAWKE